MMSFVNTDALHIVEFSEKEWLKRRGLRIFTVLSIRFFTRNVITALYRKTLRTCAYQGVRNVSFSEN